MKIVAATKKHFEPLNIHTVVHRTILIARRSGTPLEFTQTDLQRKLVADFTEFSKAELDFDVEQFDESCRFPAEQWRACANYGVFRWILPKSMGGDGHNITTTTCLLEAMGNSCADNGLAFSVAAQIWAVQKTLLQFASQDLSLIHI